MKSLTQLLNFVVLLLSSSELCLRETIQVKETFEYSETKFALKVRVGLWDGTQLQIYLYVNQTHTDYAYQWLYQDEPLARWDNKEHFPQISSYPHHFHASAVDVQESLLNGEPEHDLPVVLNYLVAHKFNL